MPLATVPLEAPAIAVKLESGSSHKSTLSKKVPAPVRTGNEETDKARKDEFDDLVEVIDILTEFPQLRAQAVRQLRSQLGGPAREDHQPRHGDRAKTGQNIGSAH